jgi:hypothetical protein
MLCGGGVRRKVTTKKKCQSMHPHVELTVFPHKLEVASGILRHHFELRGTTDYMSL